jgi:hypothetical protein
MKIQIWLVTALVSVFGLGLFAQQQTSDGGYVIIGSTESYAAGVSDFLVYKLDPAGNKQWRKNYGGDGGEDGDFIQQTSDGGYIICGSTTSYVHGTPGMDMDCLVYKVNAAGVKQWRRNYGGADHDLGGTIRQTSDGGYIVCSETKSYVNGSPGDDRDFLVYKLDPAGNKQWRKNYGGAEFDQGHDIIQTPDGGYVVIGETRSYTNGDGDVLVYRLDAVGKKLWRRHYGGLEEDEGKVIIQTSDGGYLLVGHSYTYTHGKRDFLVYRVDGSGAKLWRKNYGGDSWDGCWDAVPAADGGCILAGSGSSYTNGGNDFLIYKIDAAGAKQWRKNYGGAASDNCLYVCRAGDGGYLLLGHSKSYSHGPDDTDLLVYKINAAGQKQWRKNYGGDQDELTGRLGF